MSDVKAALLARRDQVGEIVEIPGLGEVRVRALTRAEVLGLQKLGPIDADVAERKLLALALVEPAMTEDEVAAWQAVAPAGELEPVTDAIGRLSGIEQRAVAAKMAAFRG